MKTWKLVTISGSTPEIMDYCREIYHVYTSITDREYFRLGPRGGNNRGTYRRFHKKMKEVSRRYLDEALTLEYSFSFDDDRKQLHTIVYKNGQDTTLTIQPVAQR